MAVRLLFAPREMRHENFEKKGPGARLPRDLIFPNRELCSRHRVVKSNLITVHHRALCSLWRLDNKQLYFAPSFRTYPIANPAEQHPGHRKFPLQASRATKSSAAPPDSQPPALGPFRLIPRAARRSGVPHGSGTRGTLRTAVASPLYPHLSRPDLT